MSYEGKSRVGKQTGTVRRWPNVYDEAARQTPVPCRPPYDPALLPALVELEAGGSPQPGSEGPLSSAEVAAVRQRLDLLQPPLEELRRGHAVEISEYEIRTRADAPLQLSLFRASARSDGAASPAVFFIHGGGMIAGSRYTGCDVLIEWAEQLRVVCLSVEYRLAPEHPHPVPVEDCYAGLCWAVDHAEEIGIDPNRVVVGGASAGGGLAAGVALLARDRGGPVVRGQLLDYPMLDDRGATVSSHQFRSSGPCSSHSIDRCWRTLFGTAVPRGVARDIYAAPSRAEDLSGLPPAYISVASAEAFRDEAVLYASNIWRCGGDAELHVWGGGFHTFDYIAGVPEISRAARAARASWIRRVLGD